jgi:methylated-DNA-[protein]-cysteine S-methyltransferase
METAFIKTPLGVAKIAGDENGITVISILEEGEITNAIPEVLKEAIQQLQEYF